MFFILSKILYFLILPFSWIVIGLVWSVVTKNPTWQRRCRKIAVWVIIIFSNPWLSHQAFELLEEKPVLLKKSYSVGIVLSGMVETGINIPGQTHLSQSADRIIEAVKLYNQGTIQKILITGGKAEINFPNENEGENLVNLLKSLGVPDTAILLENRARNTFENAKFTKELLGDQSGDYLLITSAFHMKRASACFRKQNFDIDTYPVDFQVPTEFSWSQLIPKSSAFENWNTVTKEMVGLIVYKMVGYI